MAFLDFFSREAITGWLGSAAAYAGRWREHRFRLPAPPEETGLRPWWERPGLGIQYQIEYRPGMNWNRDFIAFNRDMADNAGRLRFSGPFCQVDEWVELSREVGADYHMMQSKWHDGICLFDTQLTTWKTPEDYAGRFAEASRRAGIPFLFYYSSVFDHNPLFDAIQPNRRATVSFIAVKDNPKYTQYICGQYREIMERYQPDGMWLDWFWPGEGSTRATIDFFRSNYPETVLTFNSSSLFLVSRKDLHYTSYEVHDFQGLFFKIVKIPGAILPIARSAWKWANLNRRLFDHPWEVITPAGRWWQDPMVRADRDELIRMAAVVMACGGKLAVGIVSQLDGSLFPDQVEQLRNLGRWFKPRRELFVDASPLRYRGLRPPGVRLRGSRARCVAARLGTDTLLHLFTPARNPSPLRVELSHRHWPGELHACLEPEHRELTFTQSPAVWSLQLEAKDIDPVDTIIRLSEA